MDNKPNSGLSKNIHPTFSTGFGVLLLILANIALIPAVFMSEVTFAAPLLVGFIFFLGAVVVMRSLSRPDRPVEIIDACITSLGVTILWLSMVPLSPFAVLWLDVGVGAGFVLGMILFVIGLIRIGISRHRTASPKKNY